MMMSEGFFKIPQRIKVRECVELEYVNMTGQMLTSRAGDGCRPSTLLYVKHFHRKKKSF